MLENLMNVDGIIGIIIGVVVVIVLFAAGYVKAPPDEAYIISGVRKNPRRLVGQAGFRVPFFERKDKLYLKQITITVNTGNRVPTKDFINVQVNAVAKVRICPDSEKIELAQKNFLNKRPETMIADLQDSLQGNLREIIGTMSLREISQDKEAFSHQIKEKASVDMKALGIEIVTFNIMDLEDEKGLIQDMGMDNTYQIKKDASIAKAQAEKEIAVAQAEANKISNDARVDAQLEIERRNTDLAVKEAELKKIADQKKAEADAAFEIEAQTQRRTIETASVNADIARREREVDLKMREVEVAEKVLDAEVRKKAEADRFKQEQEAEARLFVRTKEAEAEKVEVERRAEAQRVRAEAERYEKEQAAEAIRVAGLAEAEAIKAKGLAEAEAIDKKAEAMKKYGQAAMAEMIVSILPEIAKEVAAPLAAIDSVQIFGGDANGVSGMSGNVPTVMAQTFNTVKAATGVDLMSIMDAHSKDAKITRNVNLTGLPETKAGQKKTVDTGNTATEPTTIVEEILGKE